MAKEDRVLSELKQIKSKLDALESEMLFLTRLVQHQPEAPEYAPERFVPAPEKPEMFPRFKTSYAKARSKK